MDVHSDYVETAKYNLSFDSINYFKAEDSGYHTSFTPGSLEHSQLSSGFLDQSVVATAFIDQIQVDYVTPEATYKYSQLKPRNDNCQDTPPPRRAVKRPFSSLESKKQTTTIPTPTTWIAGKIQGLEVSEDKENNTLPSENSLSTERNARYIYRLNICEQKFSYPITPVKRNCKLSPCRKSGRKLDFVIHSIACEKHGLQQTPQQVTQARIGPTQPILARPDQNKKRSKIDILGLLHQHSAIPPLKNIFWYLSNEDICNFCSVSSTWKDIWNLHSSSIKKEELRKHLKSARENQENCLKKRSNRIKDNNLNDGFLKEINNFINENPTPRSPQYSPRTNRFRRFIKTASLDTRMQLPCARCTLPAKVTEEPTGEEWVECTNATCSYQFCRACNCSRHPGKSCNQYDLNAPSPSKRKKCDYAVGTRKSRKNLRRLL